MECTLNPGEVSHIEQAMHTQHITVVVTHTLVSLMELNLCQKYYLRGKLLPPHSTFANFKHPPSTVRDSLSSAFSRPQSTFARPLSTLGLICAKNTTFVVSFYLRILPLSISNIHHQPSMIRFHPLSAIHNPHLPIRFRLLARYVRYRVDQIDAGTAASHTKGGRCACG